MRKFIQKRLKNQKGLTLIELLVVIVILGIIAAIVVPMVMGNRDSAEANANAQVNKVVQDASERYYAMTGSYAANAAALVAADYLREAPKCADNSTPAFTIDNDTGSITEVCEPNSLPSPSTD
ncbi:competence type IV pilus major pilin ComGC [Halalkalibacter krulwichiae]|uniref:Type II secretion system protein G n=1 Tax=Halalkalibacter krulwichiae TaxID=199441 RepID=A0A1X9MDT6_9BACI|nr:type II secretion system protein [Halalkalibacter krulwichiae]ARK31607.1 Type II secretion system protein G precursor [Halalkalibacter krulwichiae]